jgi:hypothetical protein
MAITTLTKGVYIVKPAQEGSYAADYMQRYSTAMFQQTELSMKQAIIEIEDNRLKFKEEYETYRDTLESLTKRKGELQKQYEERKFDVQKYNVGVKNDAGKTNTAAANRRTEASASTTTVTTKTGGNKKKENENDKEAEKAAKEKSKNVVKLSEAQKAKITGSLDAAGNDPGAVDDVLLTLRQLDENGNATLGGSQGQIDAARSYSLEVLEAAGADLSGVPEKVLEGATRHEASKRPDAALAAAPSRQNAFDSSYLMTKEDSYNESPEGKAMRAAEVGGLRSDSARDGYLDSLKFPMESQQEPSLPPPQPLPPPETPERTTSTRSTKIRGPTESYVPQLLEPPTGFDSEIARIEQEINELKIPTADKVDLLERTRQIRSEKFGRPKPPDSDDILAQFSLLPQDQQDKIFAAYEEFKKKQPVTSKDKATTPPEASPTSQNKEGVETSKVNVEAPQAPPKESPEVLKLIARSSQALALAQNKVEFDKMSETEYAKIAKRLYEADKAANKGFAETFRKVSAEFLNAKNPEDRENALHFTMALKLNDDATKTPDVADALRMPQMPDIKRRDQPQLVRPINVGEATMVTDTGTKGKK